MAAHAVRRGAAEAQDVAAAAVDTAGCTPPHRTPSLKYKFRVFPGQGLLRSDNCLFIICAIPVKSSPRRSGPVDPADQPHIESTMALTLFLVALRPSHLCVGTAAFNGQAGKADMAAFDDGAPPGVPVS